MALPVVDAHTVLAIVAKRDLYPQRTWCAALFVQRGCAVRRRPKRRHRSFSALAPAQPCILNPDPQIVFTPLAPAQLLHPLRPIKRLRARSVNAFLKLLVGVANTGERSGAGQGEAAGEECLLKEVGVAKAGALSVSHARARAYWWRWGGGQSCIQYFTAAVNRCPFSHSELFSISVRILWLT